MSATRSFWGQFGLVVGVALAVRLAAAVVIDRQVARTPGRICLIEGDASGYWELGRRIAHGEDFVLYDPPRFVLRMPGFPAVLGVSQLFFGANLFAARCLLAMIGALGCGFVYGLGRTLTTATAAFLAGLATALSPPLIAFSPLLLSETTFAAALTGNLWLIAKLWCNTNGERGEVTPPGDSLLAPVSVTGGTDVPPLATASTWSALGIGVTGAIAVYMRPTWLPIVPLVAVAHLIVASRHPRRWTEAVMMVIALGICLSPWIIRNAIVTRHLVITTLWDGPSLYDGLHPGATGKSDMTFFEQEQLLDRMSEYDMNREYRRRAWEFALGNPWRTLELTAIKAARYWSLFPNADQFADARFWWGQSLGTIPLFLFAVIGAWHSRRDGVLLALTAGPVLFFAAVHLLYVSSLRYRLPAEYPLWILAAVGIVAVARRWSRFPTETAP